MLTPIFCEVCGRLKENYDQWLKAQSTEEMVMIFVPALESDYSQTYDICGERCATEFVAIWVHELFER